MKLAKSTLLVWLAVLATVGFLLSMATGCKKAAVPKPIQSTLSPEQAREQRLVWNLKTLVDPYQKAGHTNPKWDEPAKRALTEFARSRSQCTESSKRSPEQAPGHCSMSGDRSDARSELRGIQPK
jgi:hypothetical protein